MVEEWKWRDATDSSIGFGRLEKAEEKKESCTKGELQRDDLSDVYSSDDQRNVQNALQRRQTRLDIYTRDIYSGIILLLLDQSVRMYVIKEECNQQEFFYVIDIYWAREEHPLQVGKKTFPHQYLR